MILIWKTDGNSFLFDYKLIQESGFLVHSAIETDLDSEN